MCVCVCIVIWGSLPKFVVIRGVGRCFEVGRPDKFGGGGGGGGGHFN